MGISIDQKVTNFPFISKSPTEKDGSAWRIPALGGFPLVFIKEHGAVCGIP